MARAVTASSLATGTQGVASAAVLVAGSLIASRILGLARVSIFAALFGTSHQMASYNAAFRIPDLLFAIVAGGAFASAFVPVFAGLLENKRDTHAWVVASSMLNLVLIALTVLSVIAFVLAPQITQVLVPGFAPHWKSETAELTRIMLVQPVLLGVGGLFASIQNSYNRFLLPAVAPVMYNLAIIVGAVTFGPVFGVYAAAWAVVAGALIMFEIQIWGVWTEMGSYVASINWRLPEAREVVGLLAPRIAGLSAFQLMLVVTTFLASSLTSAGFNAITYGWALIMFPVGALGSAVGTAIFPTLSRQSAGLRSRELEATVARSLRSVFFLAAPATIGLIVLRQPVITLLFAHGVWTAASTQATAFAVLFYGLAIAPLAMVEILARSFYALKDTKRPVMIAIGAALLDAVLSVLLIHLFSRSEGQGGLAIATAISVWLQMFFLVGALRKYLPGLIDNDFRDVSARITVSTLVMGLVVFLLVHALAGLDTSTFGSFVVVLICICAGVLVYGLLARFFRISEFDRVSGLLTSRFRRGRIST